MAGKEVVVSRKQGPARLWRLRSPDLTRKLLEVSTDEWATNVADVTTPVADSETLAVEKTDEESLEERRKRLQQPVHEREIQM
jgi:hypothetical protein